MSSSILVFMTVYLIAVASPGPGLAAVVARVLAKGTSGMPAFVAGFIVGDLFWFGLAAAGLSVLAHRFALLFFVIKYAGAAYLLTMAWKLWTAPARQLSVNESEPDGRVAHLFLAGLALTLSNPKIIIFFLAILPTIVSLERLSVADLFEVACSMAAIISIVFGAYILAAAKAKTLFTSARSVQRLYRGTGAVMAGAAVAIAVR